MARGARRSRSRLPWPLQSPHVLAIEKKPCWKRTCPLPRQCGQVCRLGAGLGAAAAAGLAAREARDRRCVFSQPRRASSKVISRWYWRSSPRRARVAPATRPRPVAEEVAEQVAEDVLEAGAEVEAAPEPAGPARRRRARSGRTARAARRRTGSGRPRSSSLKRSSAALSPGLRSGWNLSASLRYAFLSSSSLADAETPSTS